MFYDAPTPPPGIFDEFLAIPNLKADIETRGMASLVLAGNNSDFMRGHRAMFGTVSVRDWTPALIQAVINETEVRRSIMPESWRPGSDDRLGSSSGASGSDPRMPYSSPITLSLSSTTTWNTTSSLPPFLLTRAVHRPGQ